MAEPMGGDGPPDPVHPIVTWEPPEAVTGPAPGITFAVHGPRFAAYLIDSFLVVGLLLGLFLMLALVGWLVESDVTSPAPGSADPFRILAVLSVVFVGLPIAFGYFPFFWARTGQTPGMRAFHLWVVRDQDGQPISTRTAVLRLIGLYVASSVLYLGFVWIFVDKRRRGWHDLIAGTVVIHRPARSNP